MSELKQKIIWIDDEFEIIDAFGDVITELGYELLKTDNVEECLDLYEENLDSLVGVLADFKMPNTSGFELREKLLNIDKTVPFIIISGFVDKEMAMRGLELKIAAFLDKPIKDPLLKETIEREFAERKGLLEEQHFLRNCFIEESLEIIEELEPIMLAWEEDPEDVEKINAIYRYVHTLKGSSGVIDTPELTSFLHHYEDLITKLKKGEINPSVEIFTVLLKALELTQETIATLQKGRLNSSYKSRLTDYFDSISIDAGNELKEKKGTQVQDSQKSQGVAKKDGVYVTMEMLDDFMAKSGEITVIRNMLNKLVKSIQSRYRDEEDVQYLGDLLDEMHKMNTFMQQKIVELRKTPLNKITRKLPKIVRDTAVNLGKNIDFKINGNELRVDNAIANALNNCLTHMIRNCVDHGVESKEVRLERGKPEKGAVTLSFYQDDNFITVHLEDDGGGLNTENIKRKVIEKGLATQEGLDQMTDQKINGYIFAPGFSTAAKVTDVSGRGVGMDMVKSSIDGFGGQIIVDSQLEKGTTFKLIIPIPKSIFIINGLIVDSCSQKVVIPQDNIVRLVKVSEKNSELVRPLHGGTVFIHNDETIPLISLSDVFEEQNKVDYSKILQGGKELDIIVLKGDTSMYALEVEHVLDAEDVIVKEIHPAVNRSGIYKGSTFMGDASVGLIVDIDGIARYVGLETQSSNAKVEATDDLINEKTIVNEYLLVDTGSKEVYAVNMNAVFRIETVRSKEIEFLGDYAFVNYRNHALKIVFIDNEISPSNLTETEERHLIVVDKGGKYFGIVINEVVDLLNNVTLIDAENSLDERVSARIIWKDKIISCIDENKVISRSGVAGGFKFKKAA